MPGLRLSHSAGENKKTFGERKLFAYPKHSSQNMRAIEEMLQLPIQNPIEQSYCDSYHQAVRFVLLLESLFFLEGPLCAHDEEHIVPHHAHREALKNRGIFPQYNPLQSFLIEP